MGLKLININKSYGLGIGSPRKKILDNVNMEIHDGEMVAIVGRRGSGKTTLMNIMTGLSRPDSGHYLIDGKVVSIVGRMFKMASFRAKNCGIITRDPLLVSDMTLFDNITMPLNHRFMMSRKRKLKRAREVLRGLGLKGKGRFYPTEFSVLDRQKICAGRAMIGEPKYIFADEPTGSLSAADRERFMDFLEVLNSAGYTIIVFTYSKRVAAHCQRMIPVSGEAVPEQQENENDDFADRPESSAKKPDEDEDEPVEEITGEEQASPEVYEILDGDNARPKKNPEPDEDEERYARGEEEPDTDPIGELPEEPKPSHRRSGRRKNSSTEQQEDL